MTFVVGDWEVLSDLNRLRRGDDLIELEPRVMAVLEELAREPGRVVTREDLHRTVWSDVIVTDDALTRCIRELRRVLGDDARSPRFIETISKRGYRLIAPVRYVDRLDAPPPAEIHVLGSTLLGHRAEVTGGDGEDTVAFQRENVLLRATRTGAHYAVRTRTFAALTPFVTALGAFAIAFLLLYGRTLGAGHVLGGSLLAAVCGGLAGMPARRRALDRSRAAIAAFAKRMT